MSRPKIEIDGEKVIMLFTSGLGTYAISKAMNISRKIVRRYLNDHGIRRSPFRKNTLDDFWRKVSKGSEDQCWLWQAGVNNRGYGQLNMSGELLLAHRVSYSLKYGEIPKGLEVCHKCDNPTCCNPNHLFLGTHSDNMVDRLRKGRQSNAVLTPEKVKKAKEMKCNGVKNRDIALLLQVSQSTIEKAIYSRTWNRI